ncbi:MAG: glycosyltransferase family 1 protein [Chitinophagaceae bacterium]
MPKVLIDMYKLGGNGFNGLYHFCYQLGFHMAALPPKDMDLFIYLPKDKVGLFGDNVKYFVQRSRDKLYRFGTGQFDVWHVATTISWYRPFNNKTKNILTVHDLNFMEQDEFSAASRKRYLRLTQQRVDRADYLTFISEFAHQQALKYMNLGNKPYSIIYNGSNIPLTNAVCTEPCYKPTRPFLFSIGQLHSRKNFHVLPALLVGNDYELVIAGMKDFEYVNKILQEAQRLGVSDRVKLTGPVSNEEKYWYYQHCHAFVFPSKAEGFGLPVLEAMHFGKPVFLSKFTSLPEVGGDAAYYFDSFEPEAMQATFEKGMNDFMNPGKADAVKQQADKFNWYHAAEEYFGIYRQLLKK